MDQSNSTEEVRGGRDRLARLLAAANYTMTPDELAAQRKSWVIGELMLERPEMSREQAERIYNDVR